MSIPGVGNEAAYYRAALEGLLFVEARRPTRRRFGADADAIWASFRGDLTAADRIDLLLRDADTEWPGAFGARTVFDLPATADDEPFGAAWAPLDPVDAEEMWRGLPGTPASPSVGEAAEAIARAWGLSLRRIEVGPVGASDALVVAGPAAVASALEAFGSDRALDWSAQAIVVATPPAHRQLAALSAALLNTARPTALDSAARAAASPPGTARLLVSDDAADDDRRAAERLAGVG